MSELNMALSIILTVAHMEIAPIHSDSSTAKAGSVDESHEPRRPAWTGLD